MVLEDRFATLHSKIAPMVLEDRSLHSLEVLQAAGDLQGLCPIFKPQAIFKALSADLQAAGDLQAK